MMRAKPIDAQVPPSYTILLVEDEPVVREITREVLERAGYRVLEASGAEEAIRISSAPGLGPHLLITDFVMYGIDGLALTHCLRSLHPGLITILMSGYAQRDVLGDLAGDPNTTYLQKPFSLSLLCDHVAKAIAMASRRGAPARHEVRMLEKNSGSCSLPCC
jgi:two-component system cell cycle sensor histidine kinase/response regulator CckA